MSSARSQRVLDTVTVVLFVCAIVAPGIDQLVRPDSARDSSVAEQRRPAARPSLPSSLAEVATFPRSYEAHYGDTFGLRDVLLRWNGIERALGLDHSPAKVVELAPGGWCFYRGDGAREAYRGVIPFTESELDQWVARLRERRDFAASLGAKYLFVPCPSKEVVYPERTPPTWKPVGPSRLEQLLARLTEEGDVPYLDLRPALLAAKSEDAVDDWLYTRAGTHWNGRGVYTAYAAIVSRLHADFPTLDCLPRNAFVPSEQVDAPESLANLLYLRDLLPHRHYTLVPREKTHDIVLQTAPGTGAKLVTRRAEGGPRLLWLHDSFGPFAPMFESFGYVQSHRVFEFSRDVVRQARPDIVLETYVDRVLVRLRPDQPMTGNPVAPEEQFRYLKDVAWRDDGSDRFAPAQPYGRAAVERPEDGVVVRVRDRVDGLLLPAVELQKGRLALLRVVGACREPVELDVFVRAAGEPQFPQRNHVALLVEPGSRGAVVRLPAVGASFETLLRPRAPVKSVRLLEIELRRTGPPL